MAKAIMSEKIGRGSWVQGRREGGRVREREGGREGKRERGMEGASEGGRVGG